MALIMRFAWKNSVAAYVISWLILMITRVCLNLQKRMTPPKQKRPSIFAEVDFSFTVSSLFTNSHAECRAVAIVIHDKKFHEQFRGGVCRSMICVARDNVSGAVCCYDRPCGCMPCYWNRVIMILWSMLCLWWDALKEAWILTLSLFKIAALKSSAYFPYICWNVISVSQNMTRGNKAIWIMLNFQGSTHRYVLIAWGSVSSHLFDCT